MEAARNSGDEREALYQRTIRVLLAVAGAGRRRPRGGRRRRRAAGRGHARHRQRGGPARGAVHARLGGRGDPRRPALAALGAAPRPGRRLPRRRDRRRRGRAGRHRRQRAAAVRQLPALRLGHGHEPPGPLRRGRPRRRRTAAAARSAPCSSPRPSARSSGRTSSRRRGRSPSRSGPARWPARSCSRRSPTRSARSSSRCCCAPTRCSPRAPGRHATTPRATATRPSVLEVDSPRDARLAAVAMVLTQIVMVAVMTMTPIHMRDHGHGLGATGVVISIHIAAMFLPSPLTGILVDRVGRRPVIAAGAVTLLAAGVLAAVAPADSVAILAVALAPARARLELRARRRDRAAHRRDAAGPPGAHPGLRRPRRRAGGRRGRAVERLHRRRDELRDAVAARRRPALALLPLLLAAREPRAPAGPGTLSPAEGAFSASLGRGEPGSLVGAHFVDPGGRPLT